MRAFTSISKRGSALVLIWALCLGGRPAFAYDPTSPDKPQPSAQGDEFSETPYTRYGEFNEDEDEAEATTFFQYGRFFGVSAGLGFQGVTGNRGLFWRGGFPTLALKVHYWFSFIFALDLEFTTSAHSFTSGGEV